MAAAGIPVVDFADFQRPDRHHAFTESLGRGLEEFGFVAVSNHGIDTTILRDAYAAAAETFRLAPEVKGSYERPLIDRQRGYTSMGLEHAKDRAEPDLKEFWQVGRSLPPDHPLRQRNAVPENVFPSEAPQFETAFRELFTVTEHFATALLTSVGRYLGFGDAFFADMVQDGNSVIRVIHYPALPEPAPPGTFRAAPHEDINLMTVLPCSTHPGLELLTRDGEWKAVQPPPDVMICDTGDMMALLTGGRLPATTHRVTTPADAHKNPRYSLPFFVHPHPDANLAPHDDPRHEPVLASEFLRQRLKAIGVA